MVDRRKQGNLGEAAAIMHLTERGFKVCIPLTEDNYFDLVAVKDGQIDLVQVKATSSLQDNGSYEVELRHTHRNKDGSIDRKVATHKEADILFIWTPHSCYYIPTNIVDNRNSLKVSPEGKWGDFRIT